MSRQAAACSIDCRLTSVRQWRYDPPAQGPLTFDVPVRFGKAPEIMAFKPAGDAPAGGATRNSTTPACRWGQSRRRPRSRRPPSLSARLRAQAGVSGVVIIEARSAPTVRIEEAHVLRSIPLLDEAALDAVKQWEFVPTLLNGQPVPIMMTITINFAP